MENREQKGSVAAEGQTRGAGEKKAFQGFQTSRPRRGNENLKTGQSRKTLKGS